MPLPIATRVVRWQRRAGRHGLPWQGHPDAYRIWLSEVMLQQTQVTTVLDYYPRFLDRLPDVHALAAASLDDVLALWSGLGYYSRARNLHRCAGLVVAEHGGEFPRSSAALAALPGIGRSTAAAIAVFAFGERAAILDGNVKRVLTRVLGIDADLAVQANERMLWAQAEDLLPNRDIEAYTQGLMDLGATICTLRRPHCADCPLEPVCVAAREGRPQAYPVKTRKLRRGARANALLWLRHGERHWLTQRPATGVWSSLWSLPERAGLADWTQTTDAWPGSGEALPEVRHVLTHFDWALQPLQWTLPARLAVAQRRQIEADLGAGAWFSTVEALALGLPAPVRKLLQD